MSPERLDPDRFDIKDSRPTKKSDCYALGMVILEVLSGEVPFTRGCNNLMVMQKVLEGERPSRPHGAERVWFTDDLWNTLQMCWSPQPKNRPTIEVVFECLKQVSMAWEPLPLSPLGTSGMDPNDDSCSPVNETLLASLLPIANNGLLKMGVEGQPAPSISQGILDEVCLRP